MKKQEILIQLFQKLLNVKLELLENSNIAHKDVINQCNISINSIIVDNDFLFKKVDSNRSDNDTITTVQTKNSLSRSNFMNSTKSTNSSIRKGTDPKLIIKQIGQDLISKTAKENYETKELIRSNTKVTILKPKDTKIKIEIESIVKIKLERDNLRLANNKFKIPQKLRMETTSEKLNKTFHQSSNIKNKICSPVNRISSKKQLVTEKSLKKLRTDKSLNTTKVPFNHLKNKSSIISTEETTKTSRKSSFKEKTEFKKEILLETPKKIEKEYINIQDFENKTDDAIDIILQIEKKESFKKINFEEVLTSNSGSIFVNISKFLCKKSIINLKINKNMNKLSMRYFVSLKKDEMIKNEKFIKMLRDKYSMDDLMKEPETFKLSKITTMSVENINETQLTLSNNPDETMILVFRIFFQSINSKINKISDFGEFWNESCNFFKNSKLSEIIKRSVKNLDFTEENIFKISNFTNNNEKKLDPSIFSEKCKITQSIVYLLKDILEYIGLINENPSNASILFSFYRYKFENLNAVIEKLKKIEKKHRK